MTWDQFNGHFETINTGRSAPELRANVRVLPTASGACAAGEVRSAAENHSSSINNSTSSSPCARVRAVPAVSELLLDARGAREAGGAFQFNNEWVERTV